jgi:hypothetical protein
MNKVKYKRIGDDTFFVLVEGQKPIKGKIKNFMDGLLVEKGSRGFSSPRSDKKWLTDRDYNGK